MFTASDCTAKDAQRKVAEIYIPPRVAHELEMTEMRRACPSLVAGSTFDILPGADGGAHDFLRAEDRQRCRDRLRAERPWRLYILGVHRAPCGAR